MKRLDADKLGPARYGQRFHEMLKSVEHKVELAEGWRLIAIDERVGEKGRPDYVYVNDTKKQVLVVDVYTGTKDEIQTASGPESISHNKKGWLYSTEPLIRDLVLRGYNFDYKVLPRRRDVTASELH
jgi:hypothetical protein